MNRHQRRADAVTMRKSPPSTKQLGERVLADERGFVHLTCSCHVVHSCTVQTPDCDWRCRCGRALSWRNHGSGRVAFMGWNAELAHAGAQGYAGRGELRS